MLRRNGPLLLRLGSGLRPAFLLLLALHLLRLSLCLRLLLPELLRASLFLALLRLNIALLFTLLLLLFPRGFLLLSLLITRLALLRLLLS